MVVSSLHLVNTWPPHERSLSLERSLCHGGAREVHAVSEDRNLCECGCINYSGLQIPFILRLVSGGSPPRLDQTAVRGTCSWRLVVAGRDQTCFRHVSDMK